MYSSSKLSNAARKKYKITIKNMAKSYKKNEYHRFDLHVRDDNQINSPIRKNFGLKSLIFDEAYYRIRDTRTGNTIIPFSKTNNATRLSADSLGMYFSFSTKNWPKGRSYTVDILVVENGQENCYETGTTFKVV